MEDSGMNKQPMVVDKKPEIIKKKDKSEFLGK